MTTLSNTVTKVESYRSQNRLTMLQFLAFWPHPGVLQATSSLPVVWDWPSPSAVPREAELGVPICCICDQQDGQSPHLATYRGCIYAKQELERRRTLRATQGSAGRTFFSKYTTPDRSFAAAISSIGSNHHNKNVNSLQGEKYSPGHQ
jgi:hypothetical protein